MIYRLVGKYYNTAFMNFYSNSFECSLKSLQNVPHEEALGKGQFILLFTFRVAVSTSVNCSLNLLVHNISKYTQTCNIAKYEYPCLSGLLMKLKVCGLCHFISQSTSGFVNPDGRDSEQRQEIIVKIRELDTKAQDNDKSFDPSQLKDGTFTSGESKSPEGVDVHHSIV